MCVSHDMKKACAVLACYVVCEGDTNHWCEARVLTLPYTLHIIHRLGSGLHHTGRWGGNWHVMYFHSHSSLCWPGNLGLWISWKPTTYLNDLDGFFQEKGFVALFALYWGQVEAVVSYVYLLVTFTSIYGCFFVTQTAKDRFTRAYAGLTILE